MGELIFRRIDVYAAGDVTQVTDTLDGLEAETIRRAEAVDYRLHNKLKCGRPGGDVGEVLDLREGRMLPLPWNRAAKTDSLERAALPEATASQASTSSAWRRCPNATCGTMETLVVFADGDAPYGYLNLKRPEGAPFLPSWNFWRFRPMDYKAAEGVVAYRFQDACELARVLEKPAFLDWVYCLNVELFRKCKNPLGSKGNPLLMKAILDR